MNVPLPSSCTFKTTEYPVILLLFYGLKIEMHYYFDYIYGVRQCHFSMTPCKLITSPVHKS